MVGWAQLNAPKCVEAGVIAGRLVVPNLHAYAAAATPASFVCALTSYSIFETALLDSQRLLCLVFLVRASKAASF